MHVDQLIILINYAFKRTRNFFSTLAPFFVIFYTNQLQLPKTNVNHNWNTNSNQQAYQNHLAPTYVKLRLQIWDVIRKKDLMDTDDLNDQLIERLESIEEETYSWLY